MKIAVIGMGYVGLTTAAVLAELRHHVLCVDIDANRIEALKHGKVPIHEPGLEDKLTQYVRKGRLSFSDRLDAGLGGCSVVFITVGTPPSADGSADLSALQAVSMDLAGKIRSYTLVVVKSTVPPGTCEWLAEALQREGLSPDLYDVASNPEFLREGSALSDMRHPDRIVIGARNEASASLLKDVYNGIDTHFTVMSPSASETTKYASNAFLAAKISFVNELARICHALGVDVTEVAAGMGQDVRIAPHFLRAGIGYGGSCFPKDVGALYQTAVSKGVDTPILRAVKEINDTQVDWCIEQLLSALGESEQPRQVTVWGATFKPDTDDIRESRALLVISRLAASGCRVHAYDPLVRPELAGVSWFHDRYDALYHSDALILATEWNEFRETDWRKAASRMNRLLLFDGRNMIDRDAAEEAGFRYLGVGRP